MVHSNKQKQLLEGKMEGMSKKRDDRGNPGEEQELTGMGFYQCSAQVFKGAGCHLKRAHLAR